MRRKRTVNKSKDKEKTSVEVVKEFQLDFLHPSQELAWRQYNRHDLLFLIGSAGTGKSHLATGFAIYDLLQKKKSKIIITRPVVESGESLGFLPGDFNEKVLPYMMPIFDCVKKIVGRNPYDNEKVKAALEVVPLAYMRGRSQPLDANVATPDGFVLMKDIKTFDLVIGSNGKPTKVLSIHPQGIIDVYRIHFSDGTFAECSADHLWNVKHISRSDEDFETISTKNLIDLISFFGKEQYEIPICSPVSVCGKIGTIQDRFIKLWNIVKDNGVVTDHSFRFYTKNQKLGCEICYLTRSLGGIAKLDDNFVDICLTRKICEEYNVVGLCSKHIPHKIISHVEQIEKKECQCIRVDSHDGLYLTNNFTVTHNTFDDAVFILDEAQNCTHSQIKMAITRLGVNSKMIITADPEQSDLPGRSDIEDIVAKISPVSGVGVMRFKDGDIVRHSLVAKILKRI